MNKIYQKSEENFAFILIAIYCVGMTITDNVSQAIGMKGVLIIPFQVAFTVNICHWISKNGLNEKYGLCKLEGSAKKNLFFIPFLLLASVNLMSGFLISTPVLETTMLIIIDLFVGFLEEIIFRGFLFKALCKTNVKSAIIISSVTFGIGHITNLARGKELSHTLFQMIFAIAIGFVFTIFVYRQKSIWPCIITHMLINATCEINNDAGLSGGWNYVPGIVAIVVSVAYALYILKVTQKVESKEQQRVVNG